MASAIELSLRRALEKGDASDPYFRTSVYEAAERAMDRLAGEKALGAAAELQQRQQLIAAIEAIERDYPPLAEDEQEHEGDTGLVREDDGAPEPAPAPQEAYSVDEAQAEPTSPDAPATPAERLRAMFAREGAPAGPAPVDADWTPGGTRETGSLLASRKARLALAAALALLVGLLLAYVLAPGGASAPDTNVTTGSIEGGGPWINAFSGTNIDRVTAPSGGRVFSIDQAGGEVAIRVESPSGGGAETLVGLEPGVLGGIAGRRVRGELTVGSPDGQPREFSVRCVFAGETACGRQRFSTGAAEESFVFDMDVPRGAVGSGSIAIDPSIGGTASTLDIYGLRVKVL
ncbi:hypothetical protein [Aurantimonas sp. Leaf443]|uniref:hypothetical protein n=1 Tax=Aurantimonas sp. Leaf443 TaxID=1736378 RepID=UPI0006FB8C0E|nr:hypothetical protein [Aurantimonas sp. Leaf443]KQT88118.1 hypothetical protein ASG48_01325 [Aurantimonas sp. Leaf443]